MGAVGTAGNAITIGVMHSARCLDNATDRAAASVKHGVKTGAAHVEHAPHNSGLWMQASMKVFSSRPLQTYVLTCMHHDHVLEC